MHWLDYSTDNCSVQRTMNIIGEKWTMIVLREVFNGVRRFEQMRGHTGISEPILSARLRTLVDAGVLDTVPYQESGRRTVTNTGSPTRAESCIRFSSLYCSGATGTAPTRKDQPSPCITTTAANPSRRSCNARPAIA